MHQAGLRLHALKTQLFIHGSTTADVECSFVCLDFSNKCLENRIILQGFVYLFKIGLTPSNKPKCFLSISKVLFMETWEVKIKTYCNEPYFYLALESK